MKVLLTGRNGQVGRELRRALPRELEVIATSREDLDLTRTDGIPSFVRGLRPDLIINAAAYTAVDRAEQEVDAALAINARAPEVLAREAARLRIPIVHYSTDYVFDGTKDGPYAETDHPVPLGVYGRSKAIGDAAVLASGAPHLVLRIAWVYGQRPGNFMTTMLKLFGERETVRVVDDEIGGPTWCRDVADATVRTLAALSPGGELGSPEGLASRVARAGGVYHLSPAGFTSWHGFATEIAALAAASASVPMQLRRLEPIPAHEWVSAADRPRNSRLDSGRLLGELGVSIPDWREGLSRCFAGLARRSSPAHR